MLFQCKSNMHSVELFVKFHSSLSNSISINSLKSEDDAELFAVYFCRLYVSKLKARNYQDDVSSICNEKIRDHWILVFDLTPI